jgi:formiminotetrahydrofolate cyclodeaminase
MPESSDSELTQREKDLLKILGQVGAASPVELAVKTFSLPEEISESLQSLRNKRLVDVKKVPGRLSSDLVIINKRGLQLARGK